MSFMLFNKFQNFSRPFNLTKPGQIAHKLDNLNEIVDKFFLIIFFEENPIFFQLIQKHRNQSHQRFVVIIAFPGIIVKNKSAGFELFFQHLQNVRFAASPLTVDSQRITGFIVDFVFDDLPNHFDIPLPFKNIGGKNHTATLLLITDSPESNIR